MKSSLSRFIPSAVRNFWAGLPKVVQTVATLIGALGAIAVILAGIGAVVPLLTTFGVMRQVPDVFDAPGSEAYDRLVASEFEVRIIYQHSGSVPIGKVIRTVPSGNTTVWTGSTIQLYESSGLPLTGHIERALLTRAQIEAIVPDRFTINGSSEEPLKRLTPLNLCLATTTDTFEMNIQPGWSVYLGEGGLAGPSTVGSEAFVSTLSDAMRFFQSLRRMAQDCEFTSGTIASTPRVATEAVTLSHSTPDSSGAFTDYVFLRVGPVVTEIVVVSGSVQHSKYARDLAADAVINATANKP